MHAGTIVDESSGITKALKANTVPGFIVGVVSGMAVLLLILTLMVPVSIAVVIVVYNRKFKKVRDRHSTSYSAVVITQHHGMEATETSMLGVSSDHEGPRQLVSLRL